MNKQAAIIESIQVITGVTLERMQSRTREPQVCTARRLYCGIVAELMPQFNLYQIAEHIGKRVKSGKGDHATAKFYITKDAHYTETDNMYRAHRQQIVDRVNRKSATGMSGVQAWGIAWGMVECKQLTR